MKLQDAAAEHYCLSGQKGTAHPGVLLHGADAGHVAEMRRRLVARLMADHKAVATRLEATDVRRDPAALHDALRSVGFFGDRPLVIVTSATDAISEAVAEAAKGLDANTGMLVVEAGSLTGRSSLRRLFEEARDMVALGFAGSAAADPRSLAEALAEAGLHKGATQDALVLLAAYASEADRGQVARTMETLAIYALDADEPLEAEAVAKLLPATAESETDKLVTAVVTGRPAEVTSRLSRLFSGGTGDVAVAIQVGGFLRLLLEACVNGGVDSLRQPIYGRRRDTLAAALRLWREDEIEGALRAVQETDAALRSAGRRPARAMLERVLLRLAVSAQARAARADFR